MKDKKLDFENIQKRNKESVKYVRLYVIPIFAVVSFIGILLILTIPKINEIFSGIDKVSQNNITITENNNTLSALDSLTSQYNSIVQNLSVIDDIAPLGSTEVVKFRDRITTQILSNSIVISSQRLSEANTETENQDTQTVSPIILQEVPFIFTISGSYDNIVNFIKSLNSVEDFIVIKEMEFTAASNTNPTGDWQLKINIVKYQFNTDSGSDLRQLYINVPVEAQLNALIQQYINARSASTNNSLSTQE